MPRRILRADDKRRQYNKISTGHQASKGGSAKGSHLFNDRRNGAGRRAK